MTLKKSKKNLREPRMKVVKRTEKKTEIGTEKDVGPAPRTDVGVQDQGNVVKGLNPGTGIGTETGEEVVVGRDPLRNNLVLERSRETMIKKKGDLSKKPANLPQKKVSILKHKIWTSQILLETFIALQLK